MKKGEDFAVVAQRMSEDRQSAPNGGDIGYITSMLPQGFYDFETAVYNTAIGGTTDIIQSTYGYHIAKVTEEREARGEMEIAHILLRKITKGQVVEDARMRIDSLYNAIQSGSSFEKLCEQYSQDTKTNKRSGYLVFWYQHL